MPKTRRTQSALNRPTETERLYRRLLREHKRSNLTLAAFAAQKGLPAQRFSWWKMEIARRDRVRTERGRAKPAADQSSKLLPVRVVDPPPLAPERSGESYEVLLARSRHVIHLSGEFDGKRVERLVRALESTAC